MALDTKDWEGINRCLTRLYRELDSQRHPRLMLELLHELVPVDSSAVNLYKPPDELTAIEFPEHCMTAEQVALVGRYGRQSPYAAYYLATQDTSWKMTSDFMPVEEFYKLDLHRIALKPLEVNYQLGGFLVSMDGTAHVINPAPDASRVHRAGAGDSQHAATASGHQLRQRHRSQPGAKCGGANPGGDGHRAGGLWLF